MQTESLNLLMYFFAVSVFYRLEHIIILSIYYVTVQSRTVILKEDFYYFAVETVFICCYTLFCWRF